MKAFTKFALAAALAVSLGACGAKPATDNTADDAGGEEITEITPIVGGWTISEEATSTLTPEQAEIFQAAMSELVGVDYEPVAVVGKQLVAGMNYAYLCKSTVVSPEAQPTWTVVVIYQDLEGNASFTTANPIDMADLHVLTGEAAEAVGAWEVVEPAETGILPGDSESAFSAASAGSDVELTPIVLLGTQVVAGTNYQVLCIGSPAEGVYQLYDVTIYQDLDGNAEIISQEALDLTYYVTPEVAE